MKTETVAEIQEEKTINWNKLVDNNKRVILHIYQNLNMKIANAYLYRNSGCHGYKYFDKFQ